MLWPWPLTFCPQNLISSSLSRDAPVTKVRRKSVNRYWRYRGNIKLPRESRTDARTDSGTDRRPKNIASSSAASGGGLKMNKNIRTHAGNKISHSSIITEWALGMHTSDLCTGMNYLAQPVHFFGPTRTSNLISRDSTTRNFSAQPNPFCWFHISNELILYETCQAAIYSSYTVPDGSANLSIRKF